MRPQVVFCRSVPRWYLNPHRSPRCPRVVPITKRGGVFHFVWLPWFGVTLTKITRGVKVLWELEDFEWYGDLRSMKKKKQVGVVNDAHHLAALESELLAKHHALIAHCAVSKYDDGDPRKPGWFTVKTMGSAWVVEVKDPDTCARLVVVQQTFDDALTLANLLLESEEAPWEPDPWLARASTEKKKK